MNEQAPVLDLHTDADDVLLDLMERMTERVQLGQDVDVEAYVRQYPQYAEPLRKMSQTLEVLRDLAQASVAATEAVDAGQPARTTGSPLTAGALGDYRILREIGRGGMGVVYEAEQVSLDRKVALKVLPFAAMMDRRQLQRFQNEARAAASLKHPNIVQVYAVGCERAVHFYAMEYVEGETLAELIGHLRRRAGLEGEVPADAGPAAAHLADSLAAGQFAPPRAGSGPDAPTEAYPHDQTPGAAAETARPAQAALSTERSTRSAAYFRSIAEIGVQIAEALDHAHQHGVIHRDVKPSNVILDNQGKPWVTDFGLARIENDVTLTVTGDLLGTVRYMSPEQALAKRIVVDHRTDVYSLGVTLYELLTLQPAYSGQDRQELLRQIAFEDPKAPRRVNKAIPEELEIIVTKAMAKNPAERYDTAQELADDLRRFLEDRPIRARRPTLVQRAAKWSRRHKPIVWSAAVSTFLLLVLGLVGLGLGNRMIRNERDEKVAALTAETRALAEKNKALLSAEIERRRAEGNLDLALAALDAVYLDAIGRERLLGDPVSKPDEPEPSESGQRLPLFDFERQQPPLTDLERDLLKRGLDFYDQFAQRNADAPGAFVQTAQAYYRVGLLQGALSETAAAAEAYRGAVERFERLTEVDPENAEHFRRLGEAYSGMANVVLEWDAAKKLLEKSRGAYSRAIELKPDDVTLYLSRGEISDLLHDGKKADEDYEKALHLDRDNVEALLKCSHSRLWRPGVSEDRKEARECAERAVSLAPDNYRCQLALAEVLGMVDIEVVIIGPEGGVWSVPDPAPALKHYARAIELAPALPAPYVGRARFYHCIGDDHRALTDVNRAMALRPDDHELLRGRANVLTQLGQFDDALADFAKFTESEPHNPSVHGEMAQLHMRMKNWQSAVDSFTKVFEIDPQKYHWLKRRAVAYINLGQYPQALADLKRALELEPGDTSTLWWIPTPQLAGSPDHFRQGLLALADGAVERSPKPAEAYADRGSLYARLTDYERAEADLAKAADLDPQSAHVWNAWGNLCMQRGMEQEAREKYSKGIEAEPGHWLPWSSRGQANFRLRDFEAAIKDFSRVLELHPAHQEAFRLRCLAYLSCGRLEEARADLARAVPLGSAGYRIHYLYALWCLRLGEAAEYRDACAAMVAKFGQTDDPMAANFVAWTCAIAPDAVEDYAPAIALAAKAVEAQPDSDQFVNTLGAILYRAGRNDEAIERLTELDGRRGGADGAGESSPAYTWYFLAMAHHKGGQRGAGPRIPGQGESVDR